MSFFNPIKNQYDGLIRAMDDRKVLLLSNAATAMGVREDKVDKSLVKMTQKGFFGGYQPYVEDELKLVVIDKRYAPYAAIFSAEEELYESLERARRAPHVMNNRIRDNQRSNGLNSMGGFIRDLADGYVSGMRAGNNFRNAAAGLLRNVSGYDKLMPDTQSVEETLAELQASCRELKSILYAYPDNPYPQELADWLNQLNHQVQGWLGCLEAATESHEKGNAMIKLERYLQEEALPEFEQRLALYRGNRRAQSEDNVLLQEIFACTAELRNSKKKVNDLEMQLAMQRIIDLLQEISRSAGDDKIQLSRSSVNSLRSTYLPMVRKLTSQYVQYEGMRNPDNLVKNAMKETESVLSMNVPVALQKILNEMRHGSAINMESDAIALKQKLQMDGLL